ncbi:unnamed protein product [Prorocentrum cordatum]|uniref:Uncharacterized protein n=1 Tax=Prorocentrum cordatum TaxID=2364126 RepID=A0ABN9WE04_9DINO|nr:unnamed protein product [Polarella glacialis]
MSAGSWTAEAAASRRGAGSPEAGPACFGDRPEARQLSFLDAAALADTAAKRYLPPAQRLVVWCRWMSLEWSTAQELDVILKAFLAYLALDGFVAAAGRVAAAAVRHLLLPALESSCGSPLRACKALDGWKKLKPARMCLPIPRPAAMVIVGVMISLSQLPFPLFVILSFAGTCAPRRPFACEASLSWFPTRWRGSCAASGAWCPNHARTGVQGRWASPMRAWHWTRLRGRRCGWR